MPPSGVVIATSDRFVANVFLRYCCASGSAAAPFSIDETELILLDPAMFDLPPKVGEPWASASNGMDNPAESGHFYFALWDELLTEVRRQPRAKK